MVPQTTSGDLEILLNNILKLKLLKKGAESEIRLGSYLGINAVFKVRRRKSYMHPKLDSMLRAFRTRREAQALLKALEGGARVPRIIAIYPSIGVLVIEHIDGPTLKSYLSKRGLDRGLLREAGRILGRVHISGVVHGDPTTSNYIVSSEGLYLLDFGLSELRSDVESRAVDLHLFRRALESTHASFAMEGFESFKEGYVEVLGEEGLRVVERAEDMRLRGRYVSLRKKSVWRSMGENFV